MAEAESPLDPTVHAMLLRVDAMAERVSALTAILEQRSGLQQFTSKDLLIPANSTRAATLPKGTGGLILFPDGADISTITVDIAGIHISFVAGTKKNVFVPCPGATAEIAFTNTGTQAFALKYQTLSLDFATMAALAFQQTALS